MARHDINAEIFYGVRAISPPPLRIRVPHRQQSADVRRLLGDLSARVPAPYPESEERHSLSHSRGVAAAAIAHHGRVGIDVEYMCPRRDMHAMLEAFLGPMHKRMPPAVCYRVWTFGEAYFKAFGSLPGGKILGHVIDRPPDDGLYQLVRPVGAAVGVLHSQPFNEFALTVVWDMAEIAGAPNRPPALLLSGGLPDAGDTESKHHSRSQ